MEMLTELVGLIVDLLGIGLSEADIAQRIGLAQSSVNRIKLGKQKDVGFAAADALRELHRERFPERYRVVRMKRDRGARMVRLAKTQPA